MRDFVLLAGFGYMLIWVFKRPHVGVLLWCWTALIIPSYFVYGIADSIPYNKIAAVLTLVVWVLSREPKRIPWGGGIALLILFGIWGTISALTSTSHADEVMIGLDRFLKIIVFSLAVAGLMTSKDRISALLYTIYLSLGFHGAYAGIKFITSAGHYHVFGPGTSVIADNNHFALAMIALLPIVLYLYKQTEYRWMKKILAGSSLLVMASVMGTYSRGGLLGIIAVGGYAFLNSRQKMRYMVAVVPLIVLVVIFAPERWSNRMDTISTANQDTSFMGRVIAWKQSTLIALDHPFFGAGFHAVQDFAIWMEYRQIFNRLDFVPTDEPDPVMAHAAHSIYFQVLGDMGFAGLAIFLTILISAWRNTTAIIRAARDRPEWHWARDLATTLRYSLIAFYVSGAALSMAYFEYIYMIFALLIVLRSMLANVEMEAAKQSTEQFRSQARVV